MNIDEIRSLFLNFFAKHGHKILPSSSLIPANDPTLLFTNAGMVPYKKCFLGEEECAFSKVVSAQLCMRAGGKHNDLDNVGFTGRHLTLFEMLGNFSFGEYFKKEAIHFAWNFLTTELKLSVDKLLVTVHHDDDDAANIWLKDIGISANKLIRCGDEDNFWSMADTGPCGPCSEIFYDHGDSVAGGPPGSADADGDRYVEIWNMVFMQFERKKSGELIELPQKCVDTGMGLERIAAVMQGKTDNYQTDLFTILINKVANLTNTKDKEHKSLRVIADHIRSISFLLAENVLPSNVGRGYVLRRIIRRAVRYGYQLGMKEAFLFKLVPLLCDLMSSAYPLLGQHKDYIIQHLLQEEKQFFATIANGITLLNKEIQMLKQKKVNILLGTVAFKLYDTYGFPLDLTKIILAEHNISVDEKSFEHNMQKQQQLSKRATKFEVKSIDISNIYNIIATNFVGYEQLAINDAVICAMQIDNKDSNLLCANQKGTIILSRTPCYAEQGGQIGDIGCIKTNKGHFLIHNTLKQGNIYLHYGECIEGELHVNDIASVEVDISFRQAVMRNHSATHLLHAALRNVVGNSVEQRGSFVGDKYLRFDFSAENPLTEEQLVQVEKLVNDQIIANTAVVVRDMPIDHAIKLGAVALFGEKYSKQVRVLNIGNGFSLELCGGTHVANTGDIGYFMITQETGVASGIRRIEAITGFVATEAIIKKQQVLRQLSTILHANEVNLYKKLNDELTDKQKLSKKIMQLQHKLANNIIHELIDNATISNNVHIISTQLEDFNHKLMLEVLDKLRNRLQNYAIVLATVDNIKNKVTLVAGVSEELQQYFTAVELVNSVAINIGGKGGGRKDVATAGGSKVENLNEALSSVETWCNKQIKK